MFNTNTGTISIELIQIVGVTKRIVSSHVIPTQVHPVDFDFLGLRNFFETIHTLPGVLAVRPRVARPRPYYYDIQ